MNMEKDKLEELKLLSAKIRKDVLEMLEKRVTDTWAVLYQL